MADLLLWPLLLSRQGRDSLTACEARRGQRPVRRYASRDVAFLCSHRVHSTNRRRASDGAGASWSLAAPGHAAPAMRKAREQEEKEHLLSFLKFRKTATETSGMAPAPLGPNGPKRPSPRSSSRPGEGYRGRLAQSAPQAKTASKSQQPWREPNTNERGQAAAPRDAGRHA